MDVLPCHPVLPHLPVITTRSTSITDKLWIVDIMFDVKYLAALHARCSIIVLVVIYVAKRDELDLS